MYRFDLYLMFNIAVSIIFIISAIRYHNKKKEYQFDKNDETLTKLKASSVLFIAVTTLLLIMLSSILILFKWHIFLVLLIVLYIFLLINLIMNFNKSEEDSISKYFTFFSSILCFLLILSTIFLIWLRFGVTSGIDKLFNNVESVIYSLSDLTKNPNENSKNKIINGLDGLVDIYNDTVNEDYNVDKDKIKDVANNLIDSILSTNSQVDYQTIEDNVEKIIDSLNADSNKMSDVINSFIK